MIKVYNVGQGDSFLFTPKNCDYQDEPILIDCGNKKANVYKKISSNINNVLISHSHGDHLNGLEDVIKHKDITNLYIPYYFSEIWSILKYLKFNKNKKGNSLFSKKLKEISINLLKEGDELCNHIKIYNPPIETFSYYQNWLNDNSNINIEQALTQLNNLGFELPFEEILNYNSPLILNINTLTESELGVYRENSRKFIYGFFKSLAVRLIEQVDESIPGEVKKHFGEIANQVSIVFKYENENQHSCLFTGDADISVFNRLLKRYPKGTLSSDILKMPHHGSKENINDKIIKEINPKIAIFSHNNKHDHPNLDIVNLMKKNKIDDYYTNDVIKRGKRIKNQTIGLVHNLINFVP